MRQMKKIRSLNHYTYLITNTADGKKYIGLRTCECNPVDDTQYLGSSESLNNAIAQCGTENFQKEILAEWDTRDQAAEHEIQLHNRYNVAINEQYYNRANARAVGFTTLGNKEALAKAAATRASTDGKKRWAAGVEKRSSKYYSDAGYQAARSAKHLATINDPEWINTIGKEQRRKQKETANVNGFGARSEKNRQTFNDPIWKETVGKEKSSKISNLKQIRDLIKKECKHCNRHFDPANYARHHGNNCKLNKVEV